MKIATIQTRYHLTRNEFMVFLRPGASSVGPYLVAASPNKEDVEGLVERMQRFMFNKSPLKSAFTLSDVRAWVISFMGYSVKTTESLISSGILGEASKAEADKMCSSWRRLMEKHANGKVLSQVREMKTFLKQSVAVRLK